MKDDTLEDGKRTFSLEKFIDERINENVDIFSVEELSTARNNRRLVKKIYILGIKNCYDIYRNK